MDSREGLLDIVGFDAADIMRRGGVQSLHEQMKRRAELKQEEEHVISPSVDTQSPAAAAAAACGSPGVPPSSCGLCWEFWESAWPLARSLWTTSRTGRRLCR